MTGPSPSSEAPESAGAARPKADPGGAKVLAALSELAQAGIYDGETKLWHHICRARQLLAEGP